MALSDVLKLSSWSPSNLYNQVKAIFTPQPGAGLSLTPYGQQKYNATNYKAVTPPTPKTTSGGGAGYSYSGGGGGIPSWQSMYNSGLTAATGAYKPYLDQLKNEAKDTSKRYSKYGDTLKEQIPFIQKRYQALLDQLNTKYGEAQTEVKNQETAQLGRQAATAAARGTYGSSSMEGGEQMITKNTQSAIASLLAELSGKSQELSASQGQEEKGIYGDIANMLLQGENRRGDIYNAIASLAPNAFNSALSWAGGALDTSKAASDAELQRILASIRASEAGGGSGTKGTMVEYVDQYGNPQQGLINPYTGEIIRNVGYGIPGQTAEGNLNQALSTALQNGITQAELNTILAKFPYDTETIMNVINSAGGVTKPSFWQNLLGGL